MIRCQMNLVWCFSGMNGSIQLTSTNLFKQNFVHRTTIDTKFNLTYNITYYTTMALPFHIFTADNKVRLFLDRNQVVPEKLVHFFSVIIAGKNNRDWFGSKIVRQNSTVMNKAPLKTECDCLHCGVIKNGCTHNPHPKDCTYTCTCTSVGADILGDPQSAQLRNATTKNTVRQQ